MSSSVTSVDAAATCEPCVADCTFLLFAGTSGDTGDTTFEPRVPGLPLSVATNMN